MGPRADFRCLQDHRVAARKRRRNRAHPEDDRRVPRRNAKHDPTGCRTDMDRQPGISDVCTWPLICVTNEAASRSILAASATLKLTQGPEAPVSPAITVEKSAARPARMSAAASSRRRRSLGRTAAHVGNAAAAVSAANFAYCKVAAAARVAGAPVSGSRARKSLRPMRVCGCC